MAGLKAWNGSAFVDGEPRIWNGSAFVPPSSCHVWDGSQFVQVWPTSLPIEYISTATANSTSVSIGSHQAGDLLVALTGRYNSSAVPGLASGWTNLRTQSAGSLAAGRVAYKIAGTSSESSGTWSNAHSVTVLVFRNAAVRSSASIGLNGSTGDYPSLSGLDVTDWGVRFGQANYSALTDTSVPSGWISRATPANARATTTSGEIGSTSIESNTAVSSGAPYVALFTIALQRSA